MDQTYVKTSYKQAVCKYFVFINPLLQPYKSLESKNEKKRILQYTKL